MKTLKRILHSLRKDLLIMFLLALSIILLIDFWLIDIPELFFGGEILGKVVYKLSLSYISAYIFYILVVYYKEYKNKMILYPYFSKHTKAVLVNGSNLFSEMSGKINLELTENFPNSSELLTLCKTIDPNSNAPLVHYITGQYLNWFLFFDHYKRRTIESSGRVLSKLIFVESELIDILSRIEECQLFIVIDLVKGIMPIRNKDLSQYEKLFHDYIDLLKELQAYYDKKLKLYE